MFILSDLHLNLSERSLGHWWPTDGPNGTIYIEHSEMTVSNGNVLANGMTLGAASDAC